MTKARKPAADKLRREYKRQDFGILMRGKHVARLTRVSLTHAALRPGEDVRKRGD